MCSSKWQKIEEKFTVGAKKGTVHRIPVLFQDRETFQRDQSDTNKRLKHLKGLLCYFSTVKWASYLTILFLRVSDNLFENKPNIK